MKFLITICGRGGSKGVPGKNIRPLNGIPLIAYSIQMAERVISTLGGGMIYLSTDSQEIKEVASEFGLDVSYTRPDSLAGDTAGKVDVMAAALDYAESKHNCQFDYLLDLDITSPLRTLGDITKAFKLLEENDKALDIFSVNKAARNPYFNMVEQKETGFYGLVKPLNSNLKTRQSAPPVYDLNASFYIFKRAFFEQGLRSVITDSSLIYVMDHICFDIDDMEDFKIMDCLLKNGVIDIEYK